MRFSNVLIAAGLMGGAAFCWTVWVSSPTPGREAGPGRRGTTVNAQSALQTPFSRTELKSWVQQEGSDDRRAWYRLAEAHRENGDMGLAEEAWSKLIELCSTGPSANAGDWDLIEPLYYRGWAHARLGNDQQAAEDLGRAETLLRAELEGGRRDASPWMWIGWCRWHVGDRDGAAEAWKSGLNAQEEVASSPGRRGMYTLACFRALTGDRNGAVEAFNRVVGTGWSGWPLAVYDPNLESIRIDEGFQIAVRRAASTRTFVGQ